MFSKFIVDGNLRRKYRRLALGAFLVFCLVSGVIHFTLGSLIALLFPGREVALQPGADQNITIITVSRLREDPKPLARVASQTHPVVARTIPKPVPIQPREIAHFDSAAMTSVIEPDHSPSLPSGGRPKQQSGGRTSVVAMPAVMGSGPASARTARTGASGDTSGYDPSYPGRQIPSGPVWADDGPPGQSGTAGGITLGGGAGHGGLGGIHDSCSPSRGDFF